MKSDICVSQCNYIVFITFDVLVFCMRVLMMVSLYNLKSTDRFVQVTRTSGRWRDLVDPNNDLNNTYIYKGSQVR